VGSYRGGGVNFLRAAVVALPLLLGLALTAGAVAGLQYVLRGEPGFPVGSIGFDIAHDCQEDLEVSLEVYFAGGPPGANVEITITNWREVQNGCSTLLIVFPGHTENEGYALRGEGGGFQEHELPTEDITQSGPGALIAVHPRLLEGFDGVVDFRWRDAGRRLSFERVGLFIPFGHGTIGGEVAVGLRQGTGHYLLRVEGPRGYTLEESNPAPSRFMLLEDLGVYSFDMDNYGADFLAIFEDGQRARAKDYLLIAASTVLGVGLALTVGEAAVLIRGWSRRSSRD